MEINRIGGMDLPAAGDAAEARSRAAARSGDGRDGVAVSDAAKSMRAELSADDPARAEKVEKLKAMVAEGRYRPDETETARKILGR